MPWPCYLVEPFGPLFKLDGVNTTWQDLAPGACWVDEDGLHIKLPLDDEFKVDLGRTINKSRAAGDASRRLPEWTWTGTPPCVTVVPSVNCRDRYHGVITNGVVGDDVEGRKFDKMGRAL